MVWAAMVLLLLYLLLRRPAAAPVPAEQVTHSLSFDASQLGGADSFSYQGAPLVLGSVTLPAPTYTVNYNPGTVQL